MSVSAERRDSARCTAGQGHPGHGKQGHFRPESALRTVMQCAFQTLVADSLLLCGHPGVM